MSSAGKLLGNFASMATLGLYDVAKAGFDKITGKTPTPAAAPVVPDANSEEVQEAARREKLLASLATSRKSTILTQPADAGAEKATLLGG